jgi:hypothetical protein
MLRDFFMFFYIQLDTPSEVAIAERMAISVCMTNFQTSFLFFMIIVLVLLRLQLLRLKEFMGSYGNITSYYSPLLLLWRGVVLGFCQAAVLHQVLHALTVYGDVGLGLEDDVYTLDVVLHGKLAGTFGTSGGDTQLEGTEIRDGHTLGVLEQVAHGRSEFAEHGQDIGSLHGTVVLHPLGQFLYAHGLVDDYSAIPLVIGGRLFVLVLILLIDQLHNVLCVLNG